MSWRHEPTTNHDAGLPVVPIFLFIYHILSYYAPATRFPESPNLNRENPNFTFSGLSSYHTSKTHWPTSFIYLRQHSYFHTLNWKLDRVRDQQLWADAKSNIQSKIMYLEIGIHDMRMRRSFCREMRTPGCGVGLIMYNFYLYVFLPICFNGYFPVTRFLRFLQTMYI
jgi:hypothetical protein